MKIGVGADLIGLELKEASLADYIPVTVIAGGKADPWWNYVVKFSLPRNGTLLCSRVYTQFFVADSVNTLGLTASNYGRILLGN